ncbi:MAG TPA: hypothetical protein VFT27_12840 [Actinomycetota bacterium]|nr:hypothetical protein [Actinomycetota bacterium]
MDEAIHEPTHEPTPTLAEAGRLRVDIHDALVTAEEALSGPAAGREGEWAREVIGALAHLRETIEEHIEVTERPAGLYDEILENAPRLASAVQRLREEHPVLRDTTSETIARLRTTPIGTTWSLEDARDDIQRLFGKIVRHRQLGADLVWEAYNLDIGGVE